MNYISKEENPLKKAIHINENNKFESNYKKIIPHSTRLNKKIAKEINIPFINNSKKPFVNVIYKSLFNTFKKSITDTTSNLNDNIMNKTENKEKKSIPHKKFIKKHETNINFPQKKHQNIKVNKVISINQSNITKDVNSQTIPIPVYRKRTNSNYRSENITPINSTYKNVKDILYNMNNYNTFYSIKLKNGIHIRNNNKDFRKILFSNKNNKNNNSNNNKNINNKLISEKPYYKKFREFDEFDLMNDKKNQIIFNKDFNLTEGNSINRSNNTKNENFYTINKNNKKVHKYKLSNSEIKKILNLKLKINRHEIKNILNLNNINKNVNKKFSNHSITNNVIHFSNRINRLKRKINISSEITNEYNKSSGSKNDKGQKAKNQFLTFSEETRNYHKTMYQKFKHINNNSKNIHLYDDNNNKYASLEQDENIEELKSQINQKNLVINNFTNLIKEYKSTISELIDKNQKLGENSQNLLTEIEKYQNEIINLKKENSILINNNINYNYNCNENFSKQIKLLKEELEKYKEENNHLKIILIKNKNKENRQINEKSINSNQQFYIKNETKSFTSSKSKNKYHRFIYIKNFKEDNYNYKI